MVHSLTPAPEYANDKVDCYLLKLQCVRPGNYVYGYLFIRRRKQISRGALSAGSRYQTH